MTDRVQDNIVIENAHHNIISKRYVAMSAAYASADKSFKEYRKRVIDRFGEDTDTELRYGVKAEARVEPLNN